LLLIIFEALWLLFVFQINTSELIAGAIGSVIAIIAVLKTMRAAPVPFRPRLSWFRNSWRVPGAVVRDTFILLKHIWVTPQSVFVQAQLRAPANPEQGPAQRSIALIEVSMTPNTVVVDVDAEEQAMCIHMLQRQKIPQIMRDLQGP
jgi:multisubunit Na+/H+ antiporter MnhE subunit